MQWSERQLAMLREMGIRPWPSRAGSIAGASATESATAVVADEARAVEVRSIVPVARTSAMTPTLREARVDDARVVAPPTVARPSAPASPFDELARAASICTACRHSVGRRQVVFGSGSPQAHWMIVGDAPGELEDESGEPFSGKPGQLLDNMLLACGLSRAATGSSPEKQAFVTNALKCRPMGNSNPSAEELAHCEPWLLQQIASVKPRVVLAMGRYAVQSLLHSTEPLGKLRGRAHRVHGAPEVQCVVTFHPTYLLRNMTDKARAWEDLCLAMEIARS